MEPAQPEAPVIEPAKRSEINWPLVGVLVLGPAILALVGATAKSDALAIASPLVGGGIGGIVCGVLLARRFGKTTASKVLLGIAFSAILAVGIFAIGFFGCMLGGFKMDFR